MNPEQIGKNIAKRILVEEFTEKVVLYPKENAGKNHTEKYELVTEQNIAVVRRAAKFNVAIKTKSRGIDFDHDNVTLIFEFGKKK